MEMYEDRKFSNNIALCYDYMSDAFSGDEAIMTVGFCKYLYCIIFYMYFLLSPFSAWHRQTRSADLDFLMMWQRLHLKDAIKPNLGEHDQSLDNLWSQHTNYIFYRRQGRATVQIVNLIPPFLNVYMFVSAVQPPEISAA